MSRVGRRPISIPDGVSVNVQGHDVRVKGPKGELTVPVPSLIEVGVEGEKVRVSRPDDKKFSKSAHGLTRALIANMVIGVTNGFSKELEIQGVGYRAEASGNLLKLTLGLSHLVEMPVPDGLKVSVQDNKIRIEGMAKDMVGQFAAELRKIRPPEPYKGKGIRYVNEYVRRKVGKAGTA